MKRRVPVGEEVGVDLLLAGSDAFGHLADELAAAHEQWRVNGAEQPTLDWLRQMAELAGWWCGRLEAEADHAGGFGPFEAARSDPVAGSISPTTNSWPTPSRHTPSASSSRRRRCR